MSIWDKINIGEIDTDIHTINKIKFKDLGGLELILDKKGIYISIYKLQDLKIYTKLIRHFTISFKTIMGYIKKVNSYTKDMETATIIFPRFGIIDYFKKHYKNYNIIKKIDSGLTPNNIFEWTGCYKENQVIIKNYIIKNIYNNENRKIGNCGLILNLEAGQGKSYLAAGLIEKLQKKTLIICHNKSILNQWVELLTKSYPNNKIGVYYGEKKTDGDIIVGIINSLLLDDFYFNVVEYDQISKKNIKKKEIIKKDDFFSMFGYVILDEVHEYSGGKRKTIYNLIQSKYMLGLSATPDENSQGMDNINTWNCGNILVADKLDGYSVETINFKGNVSKIEYKGNEQYTKLILNEKLGVVSCSSMISQICEDPYRLYLITKIIFGLLNNNQYIFVFTDRREYLNKIKLVLEQQNISSQFLLSKSDELNISNLMGGSKASDMEYAKNQSNIILTTYQFMGTGVSIPKMDAIVLATPRKSKSKQYINRIFRLGSNYNITRKIIDIVDVMTPMKSQYYNRKKHYDTKEYPIVKIKSNWDDLEKEMKEKKILHIFNQDINNDIEHDIESNNLSKQLSALKNLLYHQSA